MKRKFPKKIVAAISGGVDSAVTAALCLREGCEVVAVTLKLKSCENPAEQRKACCSLDDDRQARAVSAKLGIPHYFLDAKADFTEKVLRRAWDEYNAGRTPNPCVLCNRFLKFGKLVEYARSIGAEGIATGHYARIEAADGGPFLLKRGLDHEKDQSYFLCGIRRDELKSVYFPLGGLTKKEVRSLAAEIGLPNAQKTESQDACFGIKGEVFSETLRSFFSAEAKPGYFIGPNGRRVGEHKGCHLYTIGQRKGLNVALGRPAYIAAIDTKSGDIRLEVEEEHLLSGEMLVEDMNWLASEREGHRFLCSVQIRYRHKAVPATVKPDEKPGRIRLRFANPQRAVTPGQAAVLYAGDTVLGGGWIS